jgi:flagellum-specific peptidoglycan hydrolase FlgJ
MITATQRAFLLEAYEAARASGHIFPQAAACEAALESSWGQSQLCLNANNIFGQKTPAAWKGGTISLPTSEFLHGAWVTVQAIWCRFPTMQAAFDARMDLLHRLAGEYPDYAAALAATTPEQFLTSVSRRWSSDPQRGAKCISILHEHADVFA